MEKPRLLMNPEEIAEYRRLVEMIPQGGTMVEIGVYLGGSLCALADLIKQKDLKVYAIDVFDNANYDEPNVMQDKDNMLSRFLDNVGKFGLNTNIDVIYRSKDALAGEVKTIGEKRVDLVFIDGDHSKEWCWKDINLALQIVKDGGIIAGHDFDVVHPGVTEAVKEAFGNKYGVGGNNVWSVRL